MGKANQSKREESLQLRKYIRYIITRVNYLKAGLYTCSENQYQFYLYLYESIKEWSKHHKIYWKFLTEKISSEEAQDLIGETERNLFRYMKRQRELLVKYIKEREEELITKYPFSDKLSRERKSKKRGSNGQETETVQSTAL